MTQQQSNELEDSFFIVGSDGNLRRPLSVSDKELWRRNFEREMLSSRFKAYLPTWLSFGTWTLEQACRVLSGIPTTPIERRSDMEGAEHLDRRANFNHLMMVAKTYPEFAEGSAPASWIEWAKKIGYPPPFSISGASIDNEPTAPESAEPPRPSNDWRARARAIADEYFDRDTACGCRDSMAGYALRVMGEMQKRDIHGPRGLIDNPKTIEREALQGDKWWRHKKK